jgi:hypothetical protein
MADSKPSIRSKSFMIYTASGFRTDIEILFNRLDEMNAKTENNSLKYKLFTKCFKDMKFGLIFG